MIVNCAVSSISLTKRIDMLKPLTKKHTAAATTTIEPEKYYLCGSRTGLVMMGPFVSLEEALKAKKSHRYGSDVSAMKGSMVLKKAKQLASQPNPGFTHKSLTIAEDTDALEIKSQSLSRLTTVSQLEKSNTKRVVVASYKDVTYAMYCSVLDNMARPDNQQVAFDFNFPAGLVKAFGDMKEQLTQISEDFKVSIAEVVKAFKQRDVFALLKGIGFNIKVLWKSLHTFTALVPKGLFRVFDAIVKSGALDSLKSGAMKIDELIHKHPILAKLGGVAIAGLLLWIWFNMSFTGNPQFDLDVSTILDALHGRFSLTDLFLSPEGLTMLTLLGTGSLLGISVTYFAAETLAGYGNLLLALIFTGAHKLHDSGLTNKIAKTFTHKRY